jgi:hypothetical protein
VRTQLDLLRQRRDSGAFDVVFALHAGSNGDGQLEWRRSNGIERLDFAEVKGDQLTGFSASLDGGGGWTDCDWSITKQARATGGCDRESAAPSWIVFQPITSEYDDDPSIADPGALQFLGTANEVQVENACYQRTGLSFTQPAIAMGRTLVTPFLTSCYTDAGVPVAMDSLDSQAQYRVTAVSITVRAAPSASALGPLRDVVSSTKSDVRVPFAGVSAKDIQLPDIPIVQGFLDGTADR